METQPPIETASRAVAERPLHAEDVHPILYIFLLASITSAFWQLRGGERVTWIGFVSSSVVVGLLAVAAMLWLRSDTLSAPKTVACTIGIGIAGEMILKAFTVFLQKFGPKTLRDAIRRLLNLPDK